MSVELTKDTAKGLKGVRAMHAAVRPGGTTPGSTARSMRLLDRAMVLRVHARVHFAAASLPQPHVRAALPVVFAVECLAIIQALRATHWHHTAHQ